MSLCIWFIACFVASANVLQFELLNVSLPSPDFDFATAIYNNRLIITNGYNHQSPLSVWSTSDDLSSNDWEQHLIHNLTTVDYTGSEAMFTHVYHRTNQHVQVNDKLFGVPFYKQSTISYSYYGGLLFILDLNTFQLDTSPWNDMGIWEGSMTSDGQNIYILGDWNAHSIQIYSILSGEWSLGSSMLIPRGHMGCSASCTYDKNPEFIYIFGGDHAYGIEDSIERYDIKNNNWTMLPETLNYPRYDLQCLYLAQYGSIYCIDGRSSLYLYNSSLEIFNVGTETIEKNLNIKLNQPHHLNYRLGMGVVANEEWLLVLGGGLYGADSTDSIEGILLYDISTAPTKYASDITSTASTASSTESTASTSSTILVTGTSVQGTSASVNKTSYFTAFCFVVMYFSFFC